MSPIVNSEGVVNVCFTSGGSFAFLDDIKKMRSSYDNNASLHRPSRYSEEACRVKQSAERSKFV